MYSKFAALSDQDWLALLKRSIREQTIDGVRFPGFPDEGTQVLFTSRKWEAALDEAFSFFQVAKKACARHGKALDKDSRYLDFGVGWGRIVRMFFKDVLPANIFGVDVTPEILGICKTLMPVGTYALSKPRGKLSYPDQTFDLVTAFSVFSHLSPDNGLHWLRELHRVLKPGGLLVVTTLSSTFLPLCRDVSANPEANDWNRQMAASVMRGYPDWKTKLANFPKDEMLYLPSGGGFATMAPSDYGWAMVQEGYARKHWGDLFDVREFVDDEKVLAQAYLVLRRL